MRPGLAARGCLTYLVRTSARGPAYERRAVTLPTQERASPEISLSPLPCPFVFRGGKALNSQPPPLLLSRIASTPRCVSWPLSLQGHGCRVSPNSIPRACSAHTACLLARCCWSLALVGIIRLVLFRDPRRYRVHALSRPGLTLERIVRPRFACVLFWRKARSRIARRLMRTYIRPTPWRKHAPHAPTSFPRGQKNVTSAFRVYAPTSTRRKRARRKVVFFWVILFILGSVKRKRLPIHVSDGQLCCPRM